MRKTLTLALAVALFGILAAVVVAQVGDDSAAVDRSATTETTETTESAPAQTTPERTTTTEEDPEPVRTETVEGDDISGPCDEAEHAGDPRCNGAVAGDGDDHGGDRREDNSGPGSSSSGHDDGDDDRRHRRQSDSSGWRGLERPWRRRGLERPRRGRRLTQLPRVAPGAPSIYAMGAGRRTVLMVEDETSITEPLSEALQREGFATEVARTAAEALQVAARTQPDLVLLDVMLPDGSGYDVCRSLRAESEVPIIMLTARGEETDRIVGLELGADDYIVKPFSAREVAARIRAVLRRRPVASSGPPPSATSRWRSGRSSSIPLDASRPRMGRSSS